MKRIAAILLGAVLALPLAGAQAQELGRLFFTPDQRAALDARRKARVPDKPAATPVTESPVTHVDGAVRRRGGKSTVWVNGDVTTELASAAALKGYAGLEAEGYRIEFRNVKLKELR